MNDTFMSEFCQQAVDILWFQSNPLYFSKAHRYLFEAIRLGDTDGYYFLGHCYGYREGFKGSKQNSENFISFYLKGAELGNARCVLGLMRAGKYEENIKRCKLSAKEAFDAVLDMAVFDEPFSCYQIATAYYYGDVRKYKLNDTAVNYADEARKWFERAAQKGMLLAVNSLGVLYYNIKDYEKAFRLYTIAVRANYPLAMCNLARLYERGQYVKRDFDKAFYYYQSAANLQCCEAISDMGRCYLYGIGVNVDYEKALYWFRMGAEQLYDESINGIAYCNYYGYGCEKNYEKAKQMFESTAKTGNRFSVYRLGIMYEDGRYMEKDLKKAFSYYQKAAKMGLDIAQNVTGNCYFYGRGTDVNYKKALYWYEMGAKQQFKDSMDNVAFCSYYGYGCEIDYEKAKNIFEENAKIDDAYAIYQLGTMYEYGKGVEKNYDRALELYHRADELGFSKAKEKFVIKPNRHIFILHKDN